MATRISLVNIEGQFFRECPRSSVEFVKNNQNYLLQFVDFDDFIYCGENMDEKKTAAVEYHLLQIRACLARTLWRHEIFIGIEVIDRLLFDLLITNQDMDFVPRFFSLIRDKQLHRDGFVLFPLHSFGVLGLGFYHFLKKNKNMTNMFLEDADLAITAQTNDTKQTMDFLNDAKDMFGIKHRIPIDTLEHFMRSRSLHWFSRNQLFAIRIRSFSGSYYENQFAYILKLRLYSAMIMMLSALENLSYENNILMYGNSTNDGVMKYGSSAKVNNFQTLDIKHYLVFETPIGGKKELSAYCVPMNVSRLELAQLSDLNVQIDPRYWTKTRAKNRLMALHRAISEVEQGYLNHVILGNEKTAHARVFRKLLISIDSFRRSFSAGVKPSEAVIFLSIAFESLLTDFYSRGVIERLHRRVKLSLRGIRGTRRLQSSVVELYKCRGEIVHTGSADKFPKLAEAQKAYVFCFQHVVSRLPHLQKKSSKPISDILGDTST